MGVQQKSSDFAITLYASKTVSHGSVLTAVELESKTAESSVIENPSTSLLINLVTESSSVGRKRETELSSVSAAVEEATTAQESRILPHSEATSRFNATDTSIGEQVKRSNSVNTFHTPETVSQWGTHTPVQTRSSTSETLASENLFTSSMVFISESLLVVGEQETEMSPATKKEMSNPHYSSNQPYSEVSEAIIRTSLGEQSETSLTAESRNTQHESSTLLHSEFTGIIKGVTSVGEQLRSSNLVNTTVSRHDVLTSVQRESESVKSSVSENPFTSVLTDITTESSSVAEEHGTELGSVTATVEETITSHGSSILPHSGVTSKFHATDTSVGEQVKSYNSPNAFITLGPVSQIGTYTTVQTRFTTNKSSVSDILLTSFLNFISGSPSVVGIQETQSSSARTMEGITMPHHSSNLPHSQMINNFPSVETSVGESSKVSSTTENLNSPYHNSMTYLSETTGISHARNSVGEQIKIVQIWETHFIHQKQFFKMVLSLLVNQDLEPLSR